MGNNIHASCQVKGCDNSIPKRTIYYSRYRICPYHASLTSMTDESGHIVRFCQQCGRFQPIEDFDHDRRTCRARLAHHNEQRRKSRAKRSILGGGSSGSPPSSPVRSLITTRSKVQIVNSDGKSAQRLPRIVVNSPKDAPADHLYTLPVVTSGTPLGRDLAEGGAARQTPFTFSPASTPRPQHSNSPVPNLPPGDIDDILKEFSYQEIEALIGVDLPPPPKPIAKGLDGMHSGLRNMETLPTIATGLPVAKQWIPLASGGVLTEAGSSKVSNASGGAAMAVGDAPACTNESNRLRATTTLLFDALSMAPTGNAAFDKPTFS